MKDISIGIIGGTRGMGGWVAGFFRNQGYSVHVSGRTTGMDMAEMTATCPVVVVAVPISATCEVIAQVGPLMSKQSLLMDITSLKAEPVAAMLKFSQSEVIGCHPLFGPQISSMQNQHVVICPARSGKWLSWLQDLLTKGGALLVETTPEKHDEFMSVVQGLNHMNTIIMGMALSKTTGPLSRLDQFTTPFFEAKAKMVEKVLTDTPSLYAEIICNNPNTAKIIKIYEQIVSEIRSPILRGDAKKLTDMMEKTAARLWPPEKGR